MLHYDRYVFIYTLMSCIVRDVLYLGVSKKKKRLSGDGSLAQLTSIRGLHRIPHYESGSTNSLARLDLRTV